MEFLWMLIKFRRAISL